MEEVVMVEIINLSGGELVCSLKDNTTLRLNNKGGCSFKSDKLTEYLLHLEKLGLIIIKEVKEDIVPQKKKTSKREKEEKK